MTQEGHPVISVVAPVYGVEKYIGRFAESLFSQSYPYVQYVFVNDGTKDRSIEILEEMLDGRFCHLKDRVIIVNKENGGLPAARKTAMEHVTGDYVYHVDSDDWLAPDALQKIADALECTSADLLYFNFIKEYEDRPKIKKEKIYTDSSRNTFISAMFNQKAFGYVWNKCVRREIYEDNDVSFPPCPYSEDTFLMTQLLGYSSHIAYLDAEIYHYRRDNPDAITRNSKRKRRQDFVTNFMTLYGIYKDVPESENPVACIMDDMLMKCAWYSMMYGFDSFNIFPFLAEGVKNRRFRLDKWLPVLIMLRLYAILKSN